ncbi:MAG: phosphatase PAP2 family protein [Daejeonella sp.]
MMYKRRKRIMLYVLGLITLGFIVLTILVCLFPASFIDREFSEEVQEYQHPVLDALMKVVSSFGYMPYSLIMVILTAVIFYLFKYKKESLYVLLTLISGLVSWLTKLAVNRPRPSESVVRIIEKTKYQSFPSGHVLFYVIFFGFLVILMYQLKSIPKWLRLSVATSCLFLIFTIPISRVYMGAHWFTDVLGGFLLGIICLYINSFLYLRKPG